MGRQTSPNYVLREYCGVFGIYSFSGKMVVQDIYMGLMNLQHRGQDSAGAATSDGKKISLVRGLGLVAEVLNEKSIASLSGHVGVAHVRYPTIGAGGAEDAQPMEATAANGRKFAIAHNGNIANYGRAKKAMEKGGTKFCSGCDVELILMAFIDAYNRKPDYFEAASEMMKKVDGGYSVVLITDNGELIAFRDPQAIRPLCWGRTDYTIVFSSESVALDIINCPLSGDLLPGEVVVVNKDGVKRKVVAGKAARHCMFEYVYFSRPDSKIDGKWVYEVRSKLGEYLAKASPVAADVIVAVPDTARSAAEGYSRASGIPVSEGLIKNRYIARTFIMPSQKKREQAVRLKLNAVRHIVEGKRIILIDDSIVRGTTSGPIVKLVRAAGAKEIHVRITCPPIIGPCFYGIDLPNYDNLIAVKKSIEEIRKTIGADTLAYQTTENLVRAVGMKKSELCLGCISEDYPTQFGQEISRRLKQESGKEGVRSWEEEG